jgi:two-component system NtrC family response regulator
MDNILVVDDEREVGNFFRVLLNEKGYDMEFAENGNETKELLESSQFVLAIVDVRLPDANGLDLLKEIKRKQPLCKVIIMTGYSTVKTAIEAIRLGADDYIEKPFDDIEILEKQIDILVSNDNQPSQDMIDEIANEIGFLIGNDVEMRHLATLAYKIASKNVNVLLEGETGTGKEVLSRFIHQASSRKDQAFIGINCGALSSSLLESELFGHEKGAFTGAINSRKGIFEIANHGTLLLDEIAETTPEMQVKLLRVLETREYMRIGGEKSRKSNTRIIAASHTNLGDAVSQHKFRADLFYRLDVVKLRIPPLRERNNDIPLLIASFLKKNDSHLIVSDEAMNLLKDYTWPGNIRELWNVVTQLTSLIDMEKKMVTPADLPEKIILGSGVRQKVEQQTTSHQSETTDLNSFLNTWNKRMHHLFGNIVKYDFAKVETELKELEQHVGKMFINKALSEMGGNRKKTATCLNISQRKLRYILNERERIIKK